MGRNHRSQETFQNWHEKKKKGNTLTILFHLSILIIFLVFLLGYFTIYTSTHTSLHSIVSTQKNMSQYTTNPKVIDLKYISHGNHSQISYTMYGGMNDYLNNQPRTISHSDNQSVPTDIDFIMRDLNNEEQSYFIDPLIEKIQNITSNKDDQARIAISIVQNIPYDRRGVDNGVITTKYPYEVLYTFSGVCGQKSELLAYMLRKLGYGVVLFKFNLENHEAVGIKCPQSYSYRNSGYCFVESTEPSIITDSSESYVGVGKLTTDPQILKISDGNSFDSVSEEYNDAMTLNSISNMGKSLDEYNYNKWLSLNNKYGIKTT